MMNSSLYLILNNKNSTKLLGFIGGLVAVAIVQTAFGMLRGHLMSKIWRWL